VHTNSQSVGRVNRWIGEDAAAHQLARSQRWRLFLSGRVHGGLLVKDTDHLLRTRAQAVTQENRAAAGDTRVLVRHTALRDSRRSSTVSAPRLGVKY
jgi:hypothetical protein